MATAISTAPDRSSQTPAVAMMLTAFMVSLSALIYQVSLTRVFSVVLWYHFVFAVVSLAVLGISIGGALVYRAGQLRGAAADQGDLGRFITLLALSLIVSVVLALRSPFSTAWGLYIVLSLIPFILTGVAMSIVFQLRADASGRLYFADLTGAAIGSLMAPLLLDAIGPVRTIYAVSGVLVLTSTALLLSYRSASELRSIASGDVTTLPQTDVSAASTAGSRAKTASSPGTLGNLSRRWWIGTSILTLTFALLLAWTNPVDVNLNTRNYQGKSLYQFLNDDTSNARIIHTTWDSFSRVDVAQEGEDANRRWIFTDGGAASEVFRFNGDLSSVEYLRQDPGFPALSQAEKGRILIIGPGGGRDILVAKLAGFREITAVEINRGVVKAVERMRDFAGPIYDMPDVTVVVADGRHYVNQTAEKYDVIYLPLVFTQAADRGGYGLAENYVFTAEAFGEYLDRLTDEGQLLLKLHGTSDLVKAITTVLSTFSARGVSETSAMTRIMITGVYSRTGAIHMPILAVHKKPLEPVSLALKAQQIHNQGMNILWAPYATRPEDKLSQIESGRLTAEQLIKLSSFDASVATDDRPFFYNHDKGLPPALVTIVKSVLVVIALFGIWVFIQIRSCHRSLRTSMALTSGYFSLIGVAFMLVELSLINRLILYLGHPTRAISSAIGLLLLFVGLGSLASSLLKRLTPIQVMRICTGVTSILLIGYLVVVGRVLGASADQPWVVKLIVSGLSIFPFAFFMGMAFPSALRLVSSVARGTVSLMWSINGMMSVVGSVTAVSVAIKYGFSTVLVLGAVGYGLACLLAVLTARILPSKARGRVV